jgi:protein-disulfide isomerase
MTMTRWEALLALPVSKDRDHIQGPPDAPATLVEYGDYECSFCAAARPVVRQVQAAMGDAMRFVFRNFPLSTVHPDAEQAAEAAEAAGARGAFWEMHEILFANQDRLGIPDLLTYAETLGLDSERIAADLAAHVFAPRVHEDFMSGVRSGVNGTPTFFVNGMRHDDAVDAQTLVAALERAALAARGA